ncbi:MAG: hypothetical protein EPO42_01555 [Gallionellaceae bacterium]|nr:MAG: hypothetical protein EPO42_01555 [Gallionellaceae bacterium]
MLDSSPLPFKVASSRHRALGKLIQVRFAEDYALRLTPAEASSLSFALVAVRDGVSPEREIYMSPIASDAAFIGIVYDTGISITLPGGKLELDWIGVGALAESLAINIDL